MIEIYLWHYWIPVFALDIPKWHFSAFMLVNAEFRIVQILNFVKRNFENLLADDIMMQEDYLTHSSLVQ